MHHMPDKLKIIITKFDASWSYAHKLIISIADKSLATVTLPSIA